MLLKNSIISILFITLIYSNLVVSNPQIAVPLISTSEQLTAEFPANQSKEKVVGGTKCDVEDHAFAVSLRRDNEHQCGASLISYNWVISAAHCFESNPEDYTVVIGHSSKTDSKSQTIPVLDYKLHPLWNLTILRNDIGVAELEKKAQTIGFVISIAKLPMKRYGDDLSNICEGNKFTAAGWGATNVVDVGLKENHLIPSKDLMCAELPYVSHEICQQYTRTPIDNIMCTASAAGGLGICKGDSGGALFCGDTIFGIVSYGYGCGVLHYPNGYTRIDRYLDFIHENIRTGKTSSGWLMCSNAKFLLLILITFKFL